MHAIVDGEKIRAMRQAFALDVKGLSELSEVSEATLRRIEAGGHEVRIATVKRLANALGVEPSSLACPVLRPTLRVIVGGAVRTGERVA